MRPKGSERVRLSVLARHSGTGSFRELMKLIRGRSERALRAAAVRATHCKKQPDDDNHVLVS